MLCDKNMRIIDEEIERLEQKELTWQTCDKLCMLYNLKKHMEHAIKDGHDKRHEHLTREMAERWMDNLESDDPARPRGAKWTTDQVRPIAQKYGIATDGDKFYEFWAVMNALYCDYYAVAKKYNVLNADFFADMAMAFIHDKDAVENKPMAYYKHIVAG